MDQPVRALVLFAPKVRLRHGDTNDYCGKGLPSQVIVHPPDDSPFVAHENIITGTCAFTELPPARLILPELPASVSASAIQESRRSLKALAIMDANT